MNLLHDYYGRGHEACWAHVQGCDWNDCPASDSIVGHRCLRVATTDVGLCAAHYVEIVGRDGREGEARPVPARVKEVSA